MKTFAILTAATVILATALPAFADHNRFGRKSLLDIDVGGHRGQVASVDANVKGVADVDIDVGANRGERGGRGNHGDYNRGCNTGCNDDNGGHDGGWKQQRGGNSLVDVDVNSGRRGGNGSLVDLDVNTNQRGGNNALIDLDVNTAKRGGRDFGASRGGGLLDLDLNLGGQSRGGNNYGRRSTGGCNNGCDFGGGVGN